MKYKKIYIEITNKCNLQCSFCVPINRTKEFIEIDKFKILLKKIEKYTKYLYFHIMGEPLLHPNINELIDLASQNFYINITTNGYLIKRIANNKNVRQINVSLHSYDSKYNKTLEEYLSDVLNSSDLLHKNNTIINFRLWTNCEYKNQIINYLEKYYNIKINLQKGFKITDNIFLDEDKEFIWPSLTNNYYNEKGACRALKDHIGILVDGTIVPCCLDSQGIINLGNIYEDDLENIITSTKYQEIEKGFKENKKIHPLCQKCNFYNLRKEA